MPDTSPSASPLPPPPRPDPARHSILLDFDGTLVEIADHPDAIVVAPALRGLLGTLAGTFRGRIALVSGRSVAQLDQFLGTSLDGFAVVGSHGAEVRSGGGQVPPARSAALEHAAGVLQAQLADLEGTVVEVKTLGVAAHFRRAPAAEPRVRAAVERLAEDTGLAIQEGKMMLELRPSGYDKGRGIAALMAEPPFAGSVPMFAGDDVTDESGFVAVGGLGGVGVLVGPARATAARYRLDDVAAVHRWLESAA
jgi:trehalose 6-phosphate phosphatase